MREVLVTIKTMLETMFPASASSRLPAYLSRIKVVETSNVSPILAVLQLVQDTVGSAPLLMVMDGIHDLGIQAKVHTLRLFFLTLGSVCCPVFCSYLSTPSETFSTQAMRDIAPPSTSLLTELLMMLSRTLTHRMASMVHVRGNKPVMSLSFLPVLVTKVMLPSRQLVLTQTEKAQGRGQRFDPLPPQWRHMISDRITLV